MCLELLEAEAAAGGLRTHIMGSESLGMIKDPQGTITLPREGKK